MKVEGVSMSGDAPGREMSFCLFFYQRVTDKGARRMYVCSDLENDANLAWVQLTWTGGMVAICCK